MPKVKCRGRRQRGGLSSKYRYLLAESFGVIPWMSPFFAYKHTLDIHAVWVSHAVRDFGLARTTGGSIARRARRERHSQRRAGVGSGGEWSPRPRGEMRC